VAAIYDRIGLNYADLRRPDPRIAAQVLAAVGEGTVLNVGAGAGSYEPATTVAAVEPSAVMVAQRPSGAAPCVRAVAEALPFADGQFDVSLAVLTTHHWTDPLRGLAELTRVSRRQVVLTWDHDVLADTFWLVQDYLPEIVEAERDLASAQAVLAAWPDADAQVLPVPVDCTDGFGASYWARPEAYLDPAARAAISSFQLQPEQVVAAAVARLEQDLADGTWDDRHGHLRTREAYDVGYRLIVRSAR
jgi:SAM-dependent methyltransferase